MRIALPGLSLSLAILIAPAAAQATDNLLLVLVDDLSPEYLGCYPAAGCSATTPVIDQLARGGIRFDRAYADPICSPSRACLQTGRYAYRSGIATIVRPGEPGLRDEELLLPEALGGSGYELAMIGKWHLGSRHGLLTPNVQGWPHFVGALDGNLPDYFQWPIVRDGQQSVCTSYATTAEVEEALAWIGSQPGPWFLLLALHAPHTPRHVPPAGMHHQNLDGLSPSAQPIPFHKAMIEAIDHELGRLLQGLGPAQATTNVILCGDNGVPAEVQQPSQGPLRAKGTVYEGGIRTPLIVNGPAVVRGGRTCDQLVHIVDLYPTVLELCGVDPGRACAGVQLDGDSLLPLLADQNVPVRTGLYSTVLDTGLGNADTYLEGRFKLIRFGVGPTIVPIPPHEELYDLVADPLETENLLRPPRLDRPGALPAGTIDQIHALLADRLWNQRHGGYLLEFGEGCSGSVGPSLLRALDLPRLGGHLHARIPTPARSPWPLLSMQVFGWSRTVHNGNPLPLDLGAYGMPGCPLLISPDAVLSVGGTGHLSCLLIPDDPGLLQTDFHLQGFTLDPTANSTGIAASPALRMVIGE